MAEIPQAFNLSLELYNSMRMGQFNNFNRIRFTKPLVF